MAVRFANGSIYDGTTDTFYGPNDPTAPFVRPEPVPPPKVERPVSDKKLKFSNGAEYDFATKKVTTAPSKKKSVDRAYSDYENHYPKMWMNSVHHDYVKKKMINRMTVPEADRPAGVFVLAKGVPETVLRRLYGAMAA